MLQGKQRHAEARRTHGTCNKRRVSVSMTFLRHWALSGAPDKAHYPEFPFIRSGMPIRLRAGMRRDQ
jgi:hypothetical protein